MRKNLLFLSLLFSCSAAIASEDRLLLTKEEKSNNDLHFIAKAITTPDVGPMIFEYLIDEDENLAQIKKAIENNMDWQTVGNITRTIELYRCIQSKKNPATSKNLYPGHIIYIHPKWIKNYKIPNRHVGTHGIEDNLLHRICELKMLPNADAPSYEKRQSCIIQELCHNNVDVNAVNLRNATPLHYAAGNNNSAAIKTLCTLQAYPDAQDDLGQTPLYWAAKYCKSRSSVDSIAMLLHYHADPRISRDNLPEKQTNDPAIIALFTQAKVDRENQRDLRRAYIKELFNNNQTK